MKQYFLYAIALLIPLAILGWFLFALGKAFASLYEDWKLGKELDELQDQAASRHQQLQLGREQRLAKGCQHEFDLPVFGMPPNVCGKCGLEREKPAGSCDHVWRLGKGAVPNSYCERCGKLHSATQ